MAAIADQLLDAPQKPENSSRIVWTLAWPVVALNSLQVVNTLLDRGFVGHLEPAAVTAHSAATNVLFLMFSLAMCLGTAATALVSRAFGAGDRTEYRTACRESLSFAVVGGFAVAAISLAISGLAARCLLPPEDHRAIELMTQFLLAYSLGVPALYVIQTLAGSLRGIGDTKSPMVISGIQILFHISLNFLFVFPSRTVMGIHVPGLDWGIVGAGAALATSAWISAVIYVAYAARTDLGEMHRMQLPGADWSRRIVHIALPAAVQALLRVFSLTAFTVVLAHVANASNAIGGMGIAFAIEGIMFMPALGLSAASGALVGQSLGMKRPERAERLAWTAAHYGALVTLCMVVPIYFASPFLANQLVESKPEIAAQAVALLRALCISEVGFSYAMIMMGAMQGAGDTVRPMWISVICMWGMRVPMAVVLALVLKYGSAGSWFSMSFTQGVQGLVTLWVFKQGGWKTVRV